VKSPELPGQSVAAALAILALWSSHVVANPYECLIEPNQTVEIRSSTEGVIEKVLVKRGDRVRAGQVLVQLESSAESSAVALAKFRSEALGRITSTENRFDYASKKFERSKELQSQNFVTAQARDEADAERRIAEAELREARENREMAIYEHRHAMDLLNRRTLRSPFDGIVMDRMLNPGDLAEAGAGRRPILKLAQVEPLRVEVVLPLAAHGKVKAKTAAEIAPEGQATRFPATVSVIDSVFDSASGTFGVRLEMPNAGGAVPAGIRCQVDFPALRGLAARTAPIKAALPK
jgi:RND family efflux transporter MFP subunit